MTIYRRNDDVYHVKVVWSSIGGLDCSVQTLDNRDAMI